MDVLTVKNRGPDIAATNYWETGLARSGKLYLTTNAGAFRLLLPDASCVSDMVRGVEGVAVSRGPWRAAGLGDAIEVLFDDGSPSPFAVHLSLPQVDRLPPPGPATFAGMWRLTAWVQRRGEPRKVVDKPCRYRLSPGLPDLRPWEEGRG